MVRVRAPTSTTRPSGSWRITTRVASQARRRDHLIALTGRTGVDVVVKRGLCHQRQRVRLDLSHRWRSCRNVVRVSRSPVESLARRGQRLHEQSAGLGRETSTDDDHAVLVLVHVEGRGSSAVASFDEPQLSGRRDASRARSARRDTPYRPGPRRASGPRSRVSPRASARALSRRRARRGRALRSTEAASQALAPHVLALAPRPGPVPPARPASARRTEIRCSSRCPRRTPG